MKTKEEAQALKKYITEKTPDAHVAGVSTFGNAWVVLVKMRVYGHPGIRTIYIRCKSDWDRMRSDIKQACCHGRQ